MNEEIEYAEMLEIPVSTVNIVRKNNRRKKGKNQETHSKAALSMEVEAPSAPLKESVIAQVNDRLNEAEEPTIVEDAFPLEDVEITAPEGRLNLDAIPERIDTVRLYSTEETEGWRGSLYPQDYPLNCENKGGGDALNGKKEKNRAVKIALNTEFIAACVLCGGIFLTNVFMPNSAINTFFRSMNSASAAAQTDTRHYTDFTLSPVVSELSDTELSLSPTGILTFTDDCCVYPAANGTVESVQQNADGSYTVKIAHSDTFTGVFNGLDTVYYGEGDTVLCNVPLGYSDGEGEVQVTMYSGGVLLNCFQLTEENCLAWLEAKE